MDSFNYKDIKKYYDQDYWDTPDVKSGYMGMTTSIGGDWHKQACGWFASVIPVKNRTLLDAGCGLGHFMRGFADLGAVVSGCDVSDFCCDFVRKNLRLPITQCALEDLLVVPEEPFDIVFCTSVLEHIPQTNIEKVLQNLIRVTTPGGIIYLEVDTTPDSQKPMPEASHVNIRPWEEWHKEFTRPVYEWLPLPQIEDALHACTQFPDFPLPEWRFTVLCKL